MNTEKNIIRVLKKLPIDIRDFPHHKLFGISVLSIPNITFMASRVQPVINNQKDSEDCTGCATSEINQGIQGIEPPDTFDFLYQMAKILQIQGIQGETEADLRSAAQSLVTYGSLLKSRSPYTLEEGLPTDKTIPFLDDWTNWPPILDTYAAKYKLGSYLNVISDPTLDAFDNIRLALWNSISEVSPTLYSAVMLGVNWRPEWTNAPGGIITDNYTVSEGGGHDLKFIGQAMVNDIIYLVAQNSWSKSMGQNGYYYFPRNVINIEAAAGYGCFNFSMLPPQQVSYMLNYGIKAGDTWPVEFTKVVFTIIKNIFKKIWTSQNS